MVSAAKKLSWSKTQGTTWTTKNIRKVAVGVDTDGETSGMGSSVDELVESSTESASEGPIGPAVAAFLYPRPSTAARTPQPTQPLKKRRGGWPKDRKRKPEIPGTKPPKAPVTAYVLFINERRKYYKDTRPECTFGEVTKLLGAEWSSMNDEQKVVYVNRSDQDKKRYRNELQAYRQSHDYQILLRKKRIKNVMRRGGTTTEESSDFTDEIDDDDSEELYCRICDQWFTSLHNKREHLYGKTHLQAITGEYQRERLAEEERALASRTLRSPERSSTSRQTLRSHRSPERPLTSRSHRLSALSINCCSKSNSSVVTTDGCKCVLQRSSQPNLQMSPSHSQEEEEEHDGDKEDEEEEEGDDEEEEDGDESEVNEDDTKRISMTGAIEGILSKVVEREKEIQSLTISASKSYQQHLNLASKLLDLKNREQKLKVEQHKLDEENQALKADADVLWMLPALFGVTPLDMVNITMKEDQQILNIDENEDSGLNIIDST
ncbi:unnamed protein product [Meganyctiphanes norvegica]|uniref:HMG box domain-containing protein n=1 Tax=Meganyctiphanes norvegica TaxID=48144 RepID=A0AAV2R475_MEGNR